MYYWGVCKSEGNVHKHLYWYQLRFIKDMNEISLITGLSFCNPTQWTQKFDKKKRFFLYFRFYLSNSSFISIWILKILCGSWSCEISMHFWSWISSCRSYREWKFLPDDSWSDAISVHFWYCILSRRSCREWKSPPHGLLQYDSSEHYL